MVFKRRNVEKALINKGFVEDRAGKHKKYHYQKKNGEITNIFTYKSHGSTGADVTNYLVARMAKQCKVSKREFEQLVKCSLSREEYERKLVESGEIESCFNNNC